TAARPRAEDPQVTESVRSSVVESLNVPVAVKCCVVPRAIVGFVGVTALRSTVPLPCPSASWPPPMAQKGKRLLFSNTDSCSLALVGQKQNRCPAECSDALTVD